jgi:spermidine/putrescine transport system permease protein
MLIFLARLQRFDRTQEEAALDLGATHVQVFWKILMPFLRPAIFSAMGLAFLTSFENYNTTVFTIQAESTLTTVLAGKVRMGTQPDLAALAVLIIGVTFIGAIAIEVAKRREMAREAIAKEQAQQAEKARDLNIASAPAQ